METAWIQVFILTLAECVAPAGKAVCQESEFDLQFLTRADCEYALDQLVSLKNESAHVIVDKGKSRCAPSARQSNVFESLDAVNAAAEDKRGWRDPASDDSPPSATRVSHKGRLENLQDCEEADEAVPCKMGDIIIEGATGDPVEVWRRDQ